MVSIKPFVSLPSSGNNGNHSPMNYSLPLLLLVILSLSCPRTLLASVLYSEDFEGYTVDACVPTGASAKWSTYFLATAQATDNGTDLLGRVKTGPAFGVNSKYLMLQDTNATTGMSLASSTSTNFGTTGQLSMSFYSPSGMVNQGDGWLLRLGTIYNNSSTAFGLFIENGSIYAATTSNITQAASALATYSLDTANTLSIVYNNSTSLLTYDGGTVASGKMDVWLNGSLVGNDLAGIGNLAIGTALANFNFTAKAAAGPIPDFEGTLYVDNIEVNSIATIPEPRTAILAGMALIGLLLVHRRQSLS